MERGVPFADALGEMQAQGIAEADPSLDVDGWDAAAKAAVLANVLLDARITPHDVVRAGIRDLDAGELREAAAAGQRLRLVSGRRRRPRRSAPRQARGATRCRPGLETLYLTTDPLGDVGIVSARRSHPDRYGLFADLTDRRRRGRRIVQRADDGLFADDRHRHRRNLLRRALVGDLVLRLEGHAACESHASRDRRAVNPRLTPRCPYRGLPSCRARGTVYGTTDRHHRRRLHPRALRTVLHDDPRRSRRARHQARASRPRRRHAALGAAVPRRRERLLPQRQPQQGERRASTSRRPAAASWWSGCWPQADVVVENFRPGTLDGVGLDAATVRRRASADRLLLDLGLRPDRTAARRARLRRGDAGRGRADEHHRRRRRAALSARRGHRRHRLGDVRGAGRAGGAARPRAHRRGPGRRPRHARRDHGAAHLSGRQLLRDRRGAGTPRQPPSDHRARTRPSPPPTASWRWPSATTACGSASARRPSCPNLAADPRFATNAGRARPLRRAEADARRRLRAREPRADWTARLLAAGVPCGAVRTVEEVFADPQTVAREMVARVAHATLGEVSVTGVPVKLSETPGSVRTGPAGARPAHRGGPAASWATIGRPSTRWRSLAPSRRPVTDGHRPAPQIAAVKAIEAATPRRRRAARPGRRGRRRYEAFLDRRRDAGVPRDGPALRAEGLLFDVITPSGGVRLVPERTREDGIELGLDADRRSAGADRAGDALARQPRDAARTAGGRRSAPRGPHRGPRRGDAARRAASVAREIAD